MSAGGPTSLASSAGLLGGHVAGRAHDLAGLGLPCPRLQPLGQAEVGDLGDAVAVEQDVGRLEVAMDDAGLVRRVASALASVAIELGRRPAGWGVPARRSARLPPSSNSSATNGQPSASPIS